METVGERIRRLRKENTLTQDDLAARLGVERVTISRYENDVFLPKPQHLHEMSEEFHCSMSYLLCKTDDPIDYENSEAVLNAPIEVIKELGSDAKKIYEFQKAQDEDALKEGPLEIADDDPDIRMIARARSNMSLQNKEKMMRILKASFDEYFDDDAHK